MGMFPASPEHSKSESQRNFENNKKPRYITERGRKSPARMDIFSLYRIIILRLVCLSQPQKIIQFVKLEIMALSANIYVCLCGLRVAWLQYHCTL